MMRLVGPMVKCLPSQGWPIVSTGGKTGGKFNDTSGHFEHDAECRALAGLPGALRALLYSRSFIGETYRYFEHVVRTEAPPYGGVC